MAQNINESNFFNTPQLLEKRGYFQRGKTKTRLTLLNQTDQDEEKSITDWQQPIVELQQTEKPAKITVTKPLQLAADPQTTDNYEDDISTDFSQKSEDLIQAQEEEPGVNQDQPDFEILPEIEQKTREKPEIDLNPQDPVLLYRNRET